MSLALAADAGLALLILGLAVWTTIARTAFGAVIGFMAYGFLVALVWVRLAAVDVALTEAALGSGLTGVLLLGAAARLPRDAPAARPGWGLRLAAGVVSAAVAAGLAAVVLLLPVPGPTLAPVATATLPTLGLGNPVTGVLIAYRAIDTLLESVVLVLALIGLWSLARDEDWGGRPDALRAANPGASLVLLAQVLPPLGLLVGVHLFWTGAIAPGGAFQGGTVLAAMWVLTLVAGLTRPPRVGGRGVRLLLVAGPALFLAIGVAGFWLGGAFLAYPAADAKPLILAIEAALTLSIAVALGLLLAGPPGARE
ncbi:hydrogenase subunit MbhD domain-containing protein [uncultured Thiodictyon sp.]|uniref:hydrogenase subunit MbhD domain-containing protein n=1 Tax=uncultured Thiodictyon sp. TaxID=1846217 RepID=UPI0025E8EB6E|nr:hydrogenase subunit MbhD domain-containing protein [uncultured Thiodictyon sp.]